MRKLLEKTLVSMVCLVTVITLLGAYWPWEYVKYPHPVNMPVSLAVGHVKTPEFKVIKDRYIILITAKIGKLPIAKQECMMGMSTGPLDPNNCDQEPLIMANWTVWSDGHIVAQGTPKDAGTFSYASDELSRYLGDFYGEKGKKYILDVNFIKDGTALAVTNPHLNVEISNASYLAP